MTSYCSLIWTIWSTRSLMKFLVLLNGFHWQVLFTHNERKRNKAKSSIQQPRQESDCERSACVEPNEGKETNQEAGGPPYRRATTRNLGMLFPLVFPFVSGRAVTPKRSSKRKNQSKKKRPQKVRGGGGRPHPLPHFRRTVHLNLESTLRT